MLLGRVAGPSPRGGGCERGDEGEGGGGDALLVTFGALCTAIVAPVIIRQIIKVAGGGSVAVGVDTPGGL